ncbi:MAG: crotonase/enoyl-CoA hydratase family protein [Myxococcota bacterium]
MPSRTKLVIEDGVAWLSLDDAKVNALSREMIDEIDRALDAAEEAQAIPVLRGRAGIFSAGFDLKTFAQGAAAGAAMVRAGAELVLRLLAFPRPVVTVCTGHAYPAGAFLMLAADVRFGAAGPWQIGLNEVAIGLTVPRFAVELARHRLVPAGLARVASATMFPPEEALRLGYLDRVVSPETLDREVRGEVERLRTLDAPSFVATKARANEPAIVAIQTALEEEWQEQPGAA